MLHEATGAVAFYDEREDVLVIDNPEDPPPLAALTEEPVPHVIISSSGRKGERHKLTADRDTASCGESWHAGLDPLVPEALEGELCKVCFTPHERDKAERARRERVRQATDEHAPLRLVDNRSIKRKT